MPLKASARLALWMLCLMAGTRGVSWSQLPGLPPSPSAGEHGVIAGVVLDNTGGSPISGANVTLSTEGDQPSDALAVTDGKGRFAFSNVPPGRYILFANCEGYSFGSYGGATRNHAPATVTLGPGEKRNNFVVRLEELGTISGVVTDQDGDPLAGASVMLWTPSFERGKSTFASRASTNTNDLGEYRFYYLDPGQYIVMSNGRGRMVLRVRPEVSSLPVGSQIGQEPQYGAQFYPGADHISRAALLTVSPGREIEHVDFRMSSKASAKLRGAVVPPPALPADAQISVNVIPQEAPGVQGAVAFMVTAPNYSFESYDLLPGEYVVVASVSESGRQYRGVQTVHIGTFAENDVTLKLDAGVDLAGSVKVEGKRGSALEFHVQLTPGDSLPWNTDNPSATVRPDGTFALKGVVPGVWDIDVEPIPEGGYVKSMRLGEQDVLTEDMVIGPETALPLRIVIGAHAGMIEGYVKTVSGQPAGRVPVLLAPYGAFANVQYFYRMAFADEKGHFALHSLNPGNYKLYAFEAVENGVWQNPQFLKPFENQGELVKISEGPNPSKEIRLITQERPRR
jgi:Carboxypeptidase regulatory-like domain